MIVDQLDLVRIAAPPFEAQAPLVVDANAPLAGPIAAQLLEAVARWNPEVLGRGGGVQDPQLAEPDALDIGTPLPDRLAVVQSFRVAVAEGADHNYIITAGVISVKMVTAGGWLTPSA